MRRNQPLGTGAEGQGLGLMQASSGAPVSFRLQRVGAVQERTARLPSLLASLGERHEPERTQAHVPSLAVTRVAKDPSLGALARDL
jgi:hypothetical protein